MKQLDALDTLDATGHIVLFNRPMDPLLINTGAAYGGAWDQRGRGAIAAAKAGAKGVLVRTGKFRQDALDRSGVRPDLIVACVGGGSNAIGAFAEFLDDTSVKLVGVEAAGRGLETDAHGATLTLGRPGVLHGSYSYVLQDAEGQIEEAHSVSAGLDYPGVGPEHSFLKDSGRVEYTAATDGDAIAAAHWLCRNEGILPALESSHALAWLLGMRGSFSADTRIVLNLSGRGDKDLAALLNEGGLS